MVIYNAATRELTAKIVYYGPGLCGKTTNLKVLHDRLEPGTAGKLLNLQTQTDRTIYFDLLPVELGDIKGYKIRFQLATVPGQTAFNETRRVVLKGVDGIVFVADSQWTMLPKNLEAWQNLKDNLKTNAINFESLPVVVQYNKRDLADILAVDAMQEALGLSSYPFVEAVASAGRGVTETFKLISKLTFVDLLRRLQGKRAEDAGLPASIDAQPQHDDLQSWKDSLLKRDSRDSAAAVPTQKPARPLSLVPPVQDDAPFDTTELGRGVMDEEPSPYSVPAPPELDAETPASPAATVQMPAISPEMLAGADRNRAADRDRSFPEAEDASPEVLGEAEEVEIDLSAAGEPVTDPAFLPPEVAHEGRLEVLEQRLRDYENRAGQEREASERLSNAVSAVQDRLAGTQDQISALTERLAAIEHGVGGLHEALNGALARLTAAESTSGKTPDLEAAVRGFEARVSEIDDRLRAEATNVSELDGRLRAEVARNRKDGDDVAMAVGGLTERAMALEQHAASLLQRVGAHDGEFSGMRSLAERLPQIENHVGSLRGAFDKMPEIEMQIEAVMRAARELEATLEEKTQLGRREAEDIRGQLAPLLEDRVRRHESDALLFSEMERLRESLAESLHDLAERVRSRVRE